MKKYQTYKSSGVEWVGDIPEHWEFIKTNILTENLDGKRVPLNSEERGKMEGEYPYWGSNGIVDYVSDFLFDEEIVLVGEDGSPFFDKLKDVSFYLNEPVWVNNHIHILKPKDKILPKYLTHSFNCVEYREFITGSTRDKLTQSDLKRIPHCVPPISEQFQIVEFLDEKTELIDRLISTKERKIDLLKQQRKSLINEVITKGLNQNVIMKNSGVDWIGEIPEKWKYVPLKYCCLKKRGIQTGPFGTQLNTKDYVENGIKVLNQKTLIDENYELGEEFISETKMNELKGFEVVGGDIILGTRGSFGTKNRTTFGKCSIVPLDIEECVLHPCLIRIRLNEMTIVKEYFKYYVNDSTLFLDEIFFTSNSTTIEVIYGTTLKDIKFPIPPIDEQKQIVEYLDNRTKEIDELVSIEQTKIDLLKEYRQSLISEVITGKIDVRN